MKLAAAALIPLLLAAQQPAPQSDWEGTRLAGRKLFEQGLFRQAEAFLSEALQQAQRMPEPGRRLPVSMRDLAEVYQAAGKLKEAEDLLRAAVILREKELGADSVELVEDIDALAWVCYGQLKIPEAFKNFRRSLAIVEAAKGAEDLAVIPPLLNVVRMTQTLKIDAESVAILERIIRIREKARGPEHADVASDLVRLARYHQAQKRTDPAEPLYLRAIQILEKANGTLHISLTLPLEELAGMYSFLERFSEAEAPLRRSIAIRERTNGVINPENASPLESLGAVLMELKRYEEAEQMYSKALMLWELKLGSDHPLLAVTLDFLAFACARQEKNEAAEKHYRRALLLRERDSVANLNNLALVLEAQSKYLEAEPYYKVALNILEKPEPPAPKPLAAKSKKGKGKATDPPKESIKLDAKQLELLRTTLDNYANLLLQLKRDAAAARLQLRVKELEGEKPQQQ
jgi:tetratricopeptide (TPR) repeat protein